MRKKKNCPQISVVMTSYNGSRFISEQVESILPQLGDDDELVISDDCSNDATVESVHKFKDSRIKLISNEKNLGLHKNFAQVVNMANGEFVFLCDQDDIWKPEKIRICKSALENHDLVIHNGIFVDENGKQQNRTIFDYRYPVLSYFSNLIQNTSIGACMVLRRSLLARLLPFPENVPMHDWYIFLCALRWKMKIEILGNELICYRRHEGNLSPTGDCMGGYSILKKLSFRWKMLLKTAFV